MLYTLWFGVEKARCFSVSTSPEFQDRETCIRFWHLDAGDPICTLIYILRPLGSQFHRSLSYWKDSESSLDSRKMKPVNLKGNQCWIFIQRTAAEAEAPILWPADTKSWLIGKDPDAGKDWRQEEKGTTEDEMVGWHCRLTGYEFEQTLGDGDEQGSLACCSPVAKSRTQLSNWIMNNNMNIYCKHIYLYKQFCWTVIPDASIE